MTDTRTLRESLRWLSAESKRRGYATVVVARDDLDALLALDATGPETDLREAARVLRDALEDEWLARQGDPAWAEDDDDPMALRAPKIIEALRQRGYEVAALAEAAPETPDRPPASDDEPLSVRDVYMFEAGVEEGKRLAATGPETELRAAVEAEALAEALIHVTVDPNTFQPTEHDDYWRWVAESVMTYLGRDDDREWMRLARPEHPVSKPETDLRETMERLADAISGERRDWHKVEVRPDDLAAVLALIESRSVSPSREADR